MKSWDAEGYSIACGSRGNYQGIIVGHAYSILRLVEPWQRSIEFHLMFSHFYRFFFAPETFQKWPVGGCHPRECGCFRHFKDLRSSNDLRSCFLCSKMIYHVDGYLNLFAMAEVFLHQPKSQNFFLRGLPILRSGQKRSKKKYLADSISLYSLCTNTPVEDLNVTRGEKKERLQLLHVRNPHMKNEWLAFNESSFFLWVLRIGV